eukprot:TRINITY_DN1452_c0_g2_i7.p1 TRINITY_DN1452_c0_g2~~TRINITY_DN1452_c0_g2_i7.p1  ORF type:complete len:301 (-),score=89.63 TRINITY_DN1452_c0_g2_i7:50-952(-)
MARNKFATSQIYKMEQRSIEGSYEPGETVIIKSLDLLKQKLDALRSDGPSKLSIITDYDDTLIKSSVNNPAFNSFQTLENLNVIGPGFFERLQQARATYEPLEIDSKLSKEEKMKYMVEWRRLSLKCFVDRKLTRERIKQATIEGKLCFRFGTADLLKTIVEAGLNLHIVSGGIKGVVTESLRLLEVQNGLNLGDAVRYIMTPDIYDEKGQLTGFGERVILTGNKQDFVTHDTCPLIHQGDNAILMGDLVEDSWVANNLHLKTTLTIGFIREMECYGKEQIEGITAVSYTHLTLPTNREV